MLVPHAGDSAGGQATAQSAPPHRPLSLRHTITPRPGHASAAGRAVAVHAALTDDDRQAAFPDVDGHRMHGNAVNSFVLFDQLEWQASDSRGVDLDSRGWIGRDRDRLWFRAEGDADGGRVGDAQRTCCTAGVLALVGRRRRRAAGLRPGPAQTWAAVGVQGLAPYWFEVEATAYVGAGGARRRDSKSSTSCS